MLTLTPIKRKVGLASYYNELMSAQGFTLAPHHYPIVQGLEDQRIDSLLVLGPPGLGKSNLLCTVYASWEIGHTPSTSILSVSSSEGLPATFMSSVMQTIQHSKTFHKYFPNVTPAPDIGWSMERGLFVAGKAPEDPNASYKAIGIGSKALTGLHCKLMILDDLHNKENASTLEQRTKVKEIYLDTLLGRADPQGCRRVAAGRWWAPDDIYQSWIQSGDWVVLELPAVRERGTKRLWYDVFVPKGLECVYTETLQPEPNQDPKSRYVRYRAYYPAVDPSGEGFFWPGQPSKRREFSTVQRENPYIAKLNYCGDMSGGTDAVFKKEDFRCYVAPEGLSQGLAPRSVQQWVSQSKGIIEDAWDTAMGQVQSESKTARLTALFVPCKSYHNGEDPTIMGVCPFHYDVYLLDEMCESVKFGDLVTAFKTAHMKWRPRRMSVEEKASGISLIQVMRTAQLPVQPIKVAAGKLERAVNPVFSDELPISGPTASVQGWAQMGRICVPVDTPWVENWMEDICSCKGGGRFTDRFDALTHLVNRAIQLSIRTGKMGSMPQSEDALNGLESPAERIHGMQSQAGMQSIAGIAAMLSPANAIDNPFAGMCGAPCHWYGIKNNKTWCAYHGRESIAIQGCGQWDAPDAVRALGTMLERGIDSRKALFTDD